MGYKLPDDIDAVSGLSWHLVAIPDDPAYRTAVLGAYTEMSDVWKWGMDAPPGEDSFKARQHWLGAIDETMEALEMGFPAQLLGYIDEVETLLRELQTLTGGCCPENTSYLPPAAQPDSGYKYDGSSGFPATWGDDETVVDLEDYQELLCGAANAWIDKMVEVAEEIDAIMESGAMIVAAIAALLSLLSGAGLIAVISYSAAAGISTAMLASWTNGLFGSAATAIEAARADILCAIWTDSGANVASAIQAAISGTAWTIWYQHIAYQDVIEIIMTGDYDVQSLEAIRSSSCGECLGEESDTGNYFHVAGGSLKDYVTSDDLNGEEIIYNHMYRTKCDVSHISQVNLRKISDTTLAEMAMNIRDYVPDTGETDGYIFLWELPEFTLKHSWSEPEVLGLSFDATDIVRFNSARNGVDGYIQFYFPAP